MYPVMVISLTIGICPGISNVTFTLRCCRFNRTIRNDLFPAIIIDSRGRGKNDVVVAIYSCSCIYRHRKIFSFDGHGMFPIMAIPHTICIGPCINDITFTFWYSRFYRSIRYDVIATGIINIGRCRKNDCSITIKG